MALKTPHLPLGALRGSSGHRSDEAAGEDVPSLSNASSVSDEAHVGSESEEELEKQKLGTQEKVDEAKPSVSLSAAALKGGWRDTRQELDKIEKADRAKPSVALPAAALKGGWRDKREELGKQQITDEAKPSVALSAAALKGGWRDTRQDFTKQVNFEQAKPSVALSAAALKGGWHDSRQELEKREKADEAKPSVALSAAALKGGWRDTRQELKKQDSLDEVKPSVGLPAAALKGGWHDSRQELEKREKTNEAKPSVSLSAAALKGGWRDSRQELKKQDPFDDAKPSLALSAAALKGGWRDTRQELENQEHENEAKPSVALSAAALKGGWRDSRHELEQQEHADQVNSSSANSDSVMKPGLLVNAGDIRQDLESQEKTNEAKSSVALSAAALKGGWCDSRHEREQQDEADQVISSSSANSDAVVKAAMSGIFRKSDPRDSMASTQAPPSSGRPSAASRLSAASTQVGWKDNRQELDKHARSAAALKDGWRDSEASIELPGSRRTSTMSAFTDVTAATSDGSEDESAAVGYGFGAQKGNRPDGRQQDDPAERDLIMMSKTSTRSAGTVRRTDMFLEHAFDSAEKLRDVYEIEEEFLVGKGGFGAVRLARLKTGLCVSRTCLSDEAPWESPVQSGATTAPPSAQVASEPTKRPFYDYIKGFLGCCCTRDDDNLEPASTLGARSSPRSRSSPASLEASNPKESQSKPTSKLSPRSAMLERGSLSSERRLSDGSVKLSPRSAMLQDRRKASDGAAKLSPRSAMLEERRKSSDCSAKLSPRSAMLEARRKSSDGSAKLSPRSAMLQERRQSNDSNAKLSPRAAMLQAKRRLSGGSAKLSPRSAMLQARMTIAEESPRSDVSAKLSPRSAMLKDGPTIAEQERSHTAKRKVSPRAAMMEARRASSDSSGGTLFPETLPTKPTRKTSRTSELFPAALPPTMPRSANRASQFSVTFPTSQKRHSVASDSEMTRSGTETHTTGISYFTEWTNDWSSNFSRRPTLMSLSELGTAAMEPSSTVKSFSENKSLVIEETVSEMRQSTVDYHNSMMSSFTGQGTDGLAGPAVMHTTEALFPWDRAVKTIPKRKLKNELVVRTEIAVLRSLDHPCICRLFETFEDENNFYLLLEHIDGRDLFDDIMANGTTSEHRTAYIMNQVFIALKYCHEQPVIHRDLKPENIMVMRNSQGQFSTERPQVKVIDFGLAATSERVDGNAYCGSGSLSGIYLAPEAKAGVITPAGDIWSAGVVLHVLLSGQLPDRDVLDGEEDLDLEMDQSWREVSEAAKELVLSLMTTDPDERVTAEEAGKHPWINRPNQRKGNSLQAMMKRFVAFQKTEKLQRAAYTAVATQLTGRHIGHLRDQFLLLDTDGNGKISREEFQAGMTRLDLSGIDLGVGANIMDQLGLMFDEMDTDGSGELEYTEWLAAAQASMRLNSDQVMRAAFRVCDGDGDDKISTAELASIIELPPEDVAELMQEFDKDGKGSLDFEEFKAVLYGKEAYVSRRISDNFTMRRASSCSSSQSSRRRLIAAFEAEREQAEREHAARGTGRS